MPEELQQPKGTSSEERQLDLAFEDMALHVPSSWAGRTIQKTVINLLRRLS